MRVSDPINSSGYFWLPSKKDHPTPGILTISHGGKVELEIIGDFSRLNDDKHNPFEPPPEKRIFGYLQGHGDVTLDNCHYISTTIGALGGATLSANRAYLGAHLDDDHSASFDSIEFSTDGLNEWAKQTRPKSAEDNDDPRTVTIKYSRPDDITIKLADSTTLSILYNYNMTSSSHKISLEAHTSIRLSFAKPTDLDSAIHKVHQLQRFLSFAMDETVYLEYVIGRSKKHTVTYQGLTPQEKPIKIFYRSLPEPPETTPRISLPQMLFSLDSIKYVLEKLIHGWMEQHATITPTMNLYFGQKSGAHRYLDGKFLALAQAIETFHRRTSDEKLMPKNDFSEIKRKIMSACPPEYKGRLSPMLIHGNDPSFKERIRRVIDPISGYFDNNEEIQKLVKGIGDTRNYLTHYDESLESKALTGQELYDTCLKIEAILQISFMRMIGFETETLDRIIRNGIALSQKLVNYE